MTEIAEATKILETGSYHFFCQACLIDRPASEQSPDERYCQGCYEFLCDEAHKLTAFRRPKWVPNPLAEPKGIIELNDNWLDGDVEEEMKELGQQQQTHREELKGNASSAPPQKPHQMPPAVKKPVTKNNKVSKHPLSDKTRGRPKAEPSIDLVTKINQLAKKDMTTREIAGALKKEGIKISHMTVNRIQNGQRALL